MDTRFKDVSMNGRMAYVIMCAEAFVASEYPDRDWTFLSRKMWKATSMNWGDWAAEYSTYIPDVFLQYDAYDCKELGPYLTEEEFSELRSLYSGITDGTEDDPADEVNYMLNKPFEIAMVYEGTVIGDGKESEEIIAGAENILTKHGISLPDYTKVLFSSRDELNGWGYDFDGRFLSVILNSKQMWNDGNDRIMEIMNRLDDSESVFPVQCPVCGEKAGHIFMHRYNERRGGIWIWCSACRSFSHMSGILPDWWENMHGIEKSRLEAVPRYPDERNNDIDEWVNTLLKHRR